MLLWPLKCNNGMQVTCLMVGFDSIYIGFEAPRVSVPEEAQSCQHYRKIRGGGGESGLVV